MSPAQMSIVDERAPAKINLTLTVHGRRSDGYHEIESLIAFTSNSGDRVRLHAGSAPGLDVSGPFADAILAPNLIETALQRLAEADARLVLGRVELEKRLPVAAGVGGGSSDAAAVLRAVASANPERADDVDWVAIAQSLGADVPVCFLAPRPALVCGMGETVFPLPVVPRLNVVLVNPLCRVPPDKTARVFAALNAPPVKTPATQLRSLPLFADSTELISAMRAKGNDLAAAAETVVPEIAAVRAALESLPGVLYVAVSGAGPTSFAVFAGVDEAERAALSLRETHPGWWVAADTLGG